MILYIYVKNEIKGHFNLEVDKKIQNAQIVLFLI